MNDQGDSSYYMPYSTGTRNHAISIVGWNDDFPADAFVKKIVRTQIDGKPTEEPLPDGAWLIKNSWGKRAYKTPDEASGFYWISYYDKSLSNYRRIIMPHIEIQCFPGRTDEQKKQCAERIADVVAETLGCKTSSVSVAITDVPEAAWKEKVWDRYIAPELNDLYKKPDYTCE